MKKIKIISFVSILITVSFFFHAGESRSQGVEYIESDIRISPRNNVLDLNQPRDLFFVVHHPRTMLESITQNGQDVDYRIMMFDGIRTGGKDLHLPYTSRIDISTEYLSGLAPGLHTFDFHFADGTIRDFNLHVVDETTMGEFGLEIISFDVDHGTSVFIRIEDKTILVDTGPNHNTRNRVVPFLKDRGIEKIDYVFLTHWHWDHVSGLASIDRNLDVRDFSSGARDWLDVGNRVEGFEVGETWYNLTDGVTTGFNEGAGEIASGQTHTDIFSVGNEFQIGEAHFTVLNAARFDDDAYSHYRSQHFGGYDNRNNRSLAFRMEYNGFVYTHGGDTYQHAQQAMMNTFDEERLKAHFYHGNHHFHGGLSTEYLKLVEPHLFFTSAEQASYDRTAYVDGVMGNVVPYLEANSARFIENLFAYEVGHVIMEVNEPDDWRYETHYIERSNVSDPLRIEISEPEEGAVFPDNADIHIKATVTDPAGSLEKVRVHASRLQLTEISEPPYEYTWQNAPTGRYMLRLDGIGSNGNVLSSSRNIQITVGDVPEPDTLVHHWAFDEGSGDIAYNSVNLSDGFINGAVWTEGKYGDALAFNGTSDFVEVPHNSSLDFEKDVTIAAWIYLKDASGDQNVLQKGRNYALFEIRGNSATPANVFNDGSNWRVFPFTQSKEYFTGGWHHVAFSYDGSQVVNYVNGEYDSSFNVSGTMETVTVPLGIGVNSPYNDSYFNGRIDEVVIFNRVLNSSQLQMVYQNRLDEISAPTSLEHDADIPRIVTLHQNHPNPFNPATIISYYLPHAMMVSLSVYDITGRRVSELVGGDLLPAGRHNVTFDAQHLASGVYIYRLRAGSQSIEKKMTLIN